MFGYNIRHFACKIHVCEWSGGFGFRPVQDFSLENQVGVQFKPSIKIWMQLLKIKKNQTIWNHLRGMSRKM